ncbi:protein PRRC1-like isoform X2 [Macrobrachium nipponense]|uniref:protein PRRC1-like isoform X2 n=1 Tax=Macrobrachium nipponense TaxID=159736 RepID=UPI0030C882E9
MNTQDIIQQAQDVFDRVTHRTSPLLPTHMEYVAGGSNSVLTNVAPPAALPSFLASPLPVSSPSVSLPAAVAVSPAPGPVPSPGPMSAPPSVIPPPSLPSSVTATPTPANPGSILPPSAPPSKIPSSASGPPLTMSASPSVVSTAPTSVPATSFVPSPGPPVQATSHLNPPPSAGNVEASVDLGSPGVGVGPSKPGWFGWIRGTVSNVGHKVAEKARSSMDTMITTLDPQMKEFIHSGGDMDIVVASDKEVKVGAVREAFQFVFGKATVVGIPAQSESVAAQPVGFAAALQSGEERINVLRSSGKVHPQQPVISVENFIVELTPDCWYDVGLLLLDDPGEDIILQTYTQVTPVPPDFVSLARAATPADYPFKSTGFATTVGSIASQNLQVHHTVWQETLTGVTRRELIVLAARTLAGLYKSRIPPIN